MESNVGAPTTTTTTLWSTVALNTPENSSERYEIKDAIGASLVDETVELHAELSSLQEILSDFNNNNDQNNNTGNMLPEPPFLRTNLEKQISVLVELLQQKMAKSNGELGLPAMLSEEEREIIKSVSRGGARSTTSHDTDHETSHDTAVVDQVTSSVSRPQTPLPQTDITISEIDKLTAELRQCFHEERERLMEDISKVQTALLCGGGGMRPTEEKTQRPSTASIKQLQHLNNKLEKEVTQTKIHHVPKPPPVGGGGKWSNNFKKLPTPPSSGSKSSSYTRSNLVVQSAAKRTTNNTAIVTIGI